MSDEGSTDFLGDGLLVNEAASTARDLPLHTATWTELPLPLDNPVADSGPGSSLVEVERSTGVSDPVLFFLTINVVVGSGMVGLPFAFNEAGLVVSLVSMLGWTAVYIVTLSWLLAALSRAGGDLDWIGLVREFLGARGEVGASVTVLCFTYGLLWSYAAMFSATASLLATSALGWSAECDIYNSPSAECVAANQVAALLFGAAMLPLSFVDIEGSGSLQAVFTAYRFAAVAIILGTVGCALATGGAAGPAAALAARMVSASTAAAAAGHGRRLAASAVSGGGAWYQGLGIAFSTISTSQICHLQAPSLVRAAREPAGALRVLGLALVTTAVLNASVGLTGLFFGEATEELATLNWKQYDGAGFGGGAGAARAPGWAVGLRIAVLAFPLLASASSFPISAVVLARNLHEIAPAAARDRLSPNGLRVGCRLVAVLPPVVLTMLLHKLSVVFDVTGLCSFVLGLALPALLVLRAHRSGRPLIGRSRHWLLRALGGRVSAYCVLLIALLSTVLSLLNATGVALR